MRTAYIVICIAMLSYLLYQYLTGGPGNLTNLYAADGEVYKVQDLPGKKKAAEIMSTIHKNMKKIIDHYSSDEFQSDKPVQFLVKRYDPSHIMENSVTSSDTSYSENKGEKIVLCLRDKNNPPEYPFIDINTIMFVVLHEIAHLMTEDLSAQDHTREFWSNFRRLLEDASKLGIYKPVNYSKEPVDYCGMKITDSPL